MKRFAALLVLAFAFPHAAGAEASLLVSSAASTIGTQVAADLVHTSRLGLGVFASRWDSQDHGTLEGYGIRLGWNLAGPLALDVRASHLEAESDDRQTTLIPLEAALVWRFRGFQRLSPYLGGGIGYYLMDAEFDDTESWDDSEKVAGYFALAGLGLDLGPVDLFAEARYHLVGTDDEIRWRGSDVEEKNSLDGPAFSAGLKLGF